SITVPSHLVDLVNPIVVKASDHLLPVYSSKVNLNDMTWGLSIDTWKTAIALLWERITTLKVSMALITNVRTCLDTFPYQMHDGKSFMWTSYLKKTINIVKGKAVTSKCPICNKEMQNLHTHMGVHILHATHGIIKVISNSIIKANPCSYCSGPAASNCEPTIKETSKGITCIIIINCLHKETFQYGTATKMCPAIWHYNMEGQLSTKHQEYSHCGRPCGLPFPKIIYDSISLTALEENKAGVPSQNLFKNVQVKENVTPSNLHTQKCKANIDKFTMAKWG
ncbi:hypothetical protein PAXRUDRAFT_151614, partial [Paxillus rubicundulus Ve08.2h10]